MNRAAPPTAPTIPTVFSSFSRTGAPVAFFRPSQRARVVPLACAGACALGAAVTLAYGLAASATAYSYYGWAVADELGRTPALAFWLFVLAGFLFGLHALLLWSLAVALYEGGIAFRSLGRIRAWAWGDLTALYVAVTREAGFFPRTRHRYTLQHTSGERASFDDRLEQVTELGALIGHQIVERHYPPVAERLNAGEPVNFGQITVEQNGIQVRERPVKWGEIEVVSVRRGYLQVHAKDGTVSGLPVGGIPNLDVLLLLLDHISDVRLEE